MRTSLVFDMNNRRLSGDWDMQGRGVETRGGRVALDKCSLSHRRILTPYLKHGYSRAPAKECALLDNEMISFNSA